MSFSQLDLRAAGRDQLAFWAVTTATLAGMATPVTAAGGVPGEGELGVEGTFAAAFDDPPPQAASSTSAAAALRVMPVLMDLFMSERLQEFRAHAHWCAASALRWSS
jgi:hypothetical protein